MDKEPYWDEVRILQAMVIPIFVILCVLLFVYVDDGGGGGGSTQLINTIDVESILKRFLE